MKNIIERYVYDVMRRLPAENKEEIEKELNANIEDMLGEDRSEEHIEEVLFELGEPRLLALQYQTKERYLISPANYDDYIRVLKVVILIVISVTLFSGIIDLLIDLGSFTPWEMVGHVFSKLVGELISSIVTAFALVTLVCWAVEKAEEKKKFRNWKLKNLPELPKQNVYKINRTGAVVSLIIETSFSIIFLLLLINYLDYLGIYENSVMVAPIFNKEVVQAFIPLLIVSALFSIGVAILRVFYAAWNVKFTSIYSLGKIFTSIVTIIFINYANMFNILMFNKIAEYLEITTNEVVNGFERGIKIFTIVICVLVVLDLLSVWNKTLKNQKN